MLEYNRDKAIETIGGSQFDLVLVASERARQISNGSEPKVETEHRSGITALIEVQEGLYTKEDFIKDIAKRKK